MKIKIILPCALLALLGFTACQQTTEKTVEQATSSVNVDLKKLHFDYF